MPKRTQSYNAWQMDKLSKPTFAVDYLNSCLEDSLEMFLLALRKVAQAHEMAKVAKDAGIKRETLYHALSEEGNPTLQTLSSILDAVGLRVCVESKDVESASSPTLPSTLASSSLTGAGIVKGKLSSFSGTISSYGITAPSTYTLQTYSQDFSQIGNTFKIEQEPNNSGVILQSKSDRVWEAA